jgi:single-strand DNA-binding protein
MLKLNMIGHLGRDCTTNVVNGKAVINFNVAHSERYRDQSGAQKEKTTWVDCAYWTEKAAIVPYLRKGQLVYVEGVPELRTFTRNDGSPGSALSLRVFGVQLLGSSKSADPLQEGEEMVVATDESSDLPF